MTYRPLCCESQVHRPSNQARLSLEYSHVNKVADISVSPSLRARSHERGMVDCTHCSSLRAHSSPSTCSLAAATTCSGVKPNFFCKSLSGAEAPKDRMPMLCPVTPTYLAQPKIEACSTDTRAVTSGGSTRSRYSRGWSSNNSQLGMLTTRPL